MDQIPPYLRAFRRNYRLLESTKLPFFFNFLNHPIILKCQEQLGRLVLAVCSVLTARCWPSWQLFLLFAIQRRGKIPQNAYAQHAPYIALGMHPNRVCRSGLAPMQIPPEPPL